MNAESTCALVVMAKAPVPGQVNTRLILALGERGATELYRELLRRTLTTAAAAACGDILLYCYPTTEHPGLAGLAAEYPLTLHRQEGNDLGQRMSRALEQALERHDCAMVIGCDAPELSPSDLQTARSRLLDGTDAVLGPAEDGGYYLLGLSRPRPELFHDLPWGEGRVLEITRQRLRDSGLDWHELPLHWDVDRPPDVERYQRLSGSRINLLDRG